MIRISTINELDAERERQFNAWIKAGKEKYEFCLSLKEADLNRANLSGVYLRWADLRGADLSGAKLTEAKLTGANYTTQK